METRGPTRGAILVAVFFTLSVFCVTLFFWKSFGGSTPLQPEGYRFHASFAQAANLYPNADVRISGVPVGRVVSIAHRGQRTDAVMQLDDRYAPLRDDARAILRQKTLLGETYVELTPGTRSARKLPEGGRLRTAQIGQTQQLDQVLGTFDTPTRKAVRRLVINLAALVRHRGSDLNDALGNAAPATEDLSTIVRVLDRQRGSVRALVHDSARVLLALGQRQGDLQSLVTAGNSLLETTAARNRDLSATVRALPPFLRSLRGTLTALGRTGEQVAPSVRELRSLAPALHTSLLESAKLAPELAGLFRELPPVMQAARSGLPAATRIFNTARPFVDVLYPIGREIEPFFELTRAYRTDVATALAKTAAATEASTPGPNGTPLHYLRVLIPLMNEGFTGFPTRLPTNRHNPYWRPGSLSDFLHGGLRAFDCDNTSNPPVFPPLGVGAGPPPCRVQGPWSFLGKRRYFPHVKRANPLAH